MVAECAVLFAVEHLQHGAGRVAAEIVAHLVDFVEQEYRVHRASLLHAGDNPPWNRADICPAMAADFRLVTHAAERHLHELPPANDGRFAHAGRADEA